MSKVATQRQLKVMQCFRQRTDLPKDGAQTEAACHDSPQQAASGDHPDPVEVVPCMADAQCADSKQGRT